MWYVTIYFALEYHKFVPQIEIRLKWRNRLNIIIGLYGYYGK